MRRFEKQSDNTMNYSSVSESKFKALDANLKLQYLSGFNFYYHFCHLAPHFKSLQKSWKKYDRASVLNFGSIYKQYYGHRVETAVNRSISIE